ncbi:MAG: prolipoprotein diacylglyceryl transferase [Syntrophotaleaceae bacterium]
MINVIFLLALALFCTILLAWGFRYLPDRQWQVWATVPSYNRHSETWQGTNLTWYGVLTATANLVAMGVVFCLLGSLGISPLAILALACLLLSGCVPAARWTARLVEGKNHTFTVGGAVFVGFLLAPWIALGMGRLLPGLGDHPLPVLPTLAALAIGYAFGEGIGRLACISYGCCYGKPLRGCGPRVRKIFRRCHFVFSGETKKIAYASGLEGEEVVPVQALTAVIYCLTGLVSAYLFLSGWYAAAFLLASLVTQLWRVFSETLRADFRGGRKLSAYQVMGLLLVPWSVWLAFHFSAVHALPDLAAGLSAFWHPAVLLVLQATWLVMFALFGRSEVTGAHLNFFIRHDRI